MSWWSARRDGEGPAAPGARWAAERVSLGRLQEEVRVRSPLTTRLQAVLCSQPAAAGDQASGANPGLYRAWDHVADQWRTESSVADCSSLEG